MEMEVNNASSSSKPLENKWLHVSVLVVAALIAYSKIFSAGFMPWDDTEYVVTNLDVHGLGWEKIKLWFTEYYIGNYQPLTVFSYAIDYALGKQDPTVYHVTNILLHIANAALVYGIFSKLGRSKWVGLFTALLFTLHPSQTESVSWVAERKNVLYGLFYLLAIWSYLKYVASNKGKNILLVFVFGLCSMLSKGTAVALPLSLLAIDIWLGRSLKDSKVWIEKTPLLFLSLIFGIVAIDAQAQDEFLNLNPQSSIFHSIVYASYAWCTYIVKLVFPYKLSVLYPHPQELEAAHFIALIAALGIAAACIWLYRKGEKALAGGILFYTVNIALVLQFVQFGKVLTADGYVYIPCIGIFFPIVYYIIEFCKKRWKERYAHMVLAAVSLLFLAMTFVRNDIWLSEFNFWQAVIKTFPESTVAQYTMGGIYMKIGKHDLAMQHVDKSLEIDPNNHRAWYNKALIYQRIGKQREAFDALNKSIAIEPYSKALFLRGIMLQSSGRAKQALADFDGVIVEEPENARAHYLRGKCLEELGNLPAALDAYNTAISNNNEESLFFMQRGLLLARGGKFDDAMQDLTQAIELNPKEGQAWYWRGVLKSNMGKNPCDDLKRALQNNFPEAQKAMAKMCGGG